MQPLNTTTGLCSRCHTATERFAADEGRFEVETRIAHTAARCERVRLQVCERCHQPGERLRRSRRTGLMTCTRCRAEHVRLVVARLG